MGEQGFANVSHGCVNMSPADAAIYYEMAVPGDPVKITGSPTGRHLGQRLDDVVPVLEGRWVRGSALHKAVRVGPDGSTWVRPSVLKKSHAKAPLGRPKPDNAAAS